MKIFLDGKIFSLQKVGGISRLSFELIKSLSKKKDVQQIFFHGLYVDNYPFKKQWFKKYYGFKMPILLKGRVINLLNNLGIELSYKLNACKNSCGHHGLCLDGICRCEVGWQGEDCSDEICPLGLNGVVCSGFGQCD